MHINSLDAIEKTHPEEHDKCDFCVRGSETAGLTTFTVVRNTYSDDYKSKSITNHMTCEECLQEFRTLNEDMTWYEFGPKEIHRNFSWRLAEKCGFCGLELASEEVRGEYTTFADHEKVDGWEGDAALCQNCTQIVLKFLRQMADR